MGYYNKMWMLSTFNSSLFQHMDGIKSSKVNKIYVNIILKIIKFLVK